MAEKELLAEYAAECSISAVGPIDLHEPTYAALESSGAMRSFGAFDRGRMVGFSSVLTPVMPHYSRRVASPESIFAAKGSGSAGRELMGALTQYAKDADCVGMLLSAPVNGRLERLMEADKRYERTNSIFYRAFA